MSYIINTTIEIDASQEAVWSVLVDLPASDSMFIEGGAAPGLNLEGPTVKDIPAGAVPAEVSLRSPAPRSCR